MKIRLCVIHHHIVHSKGVFWWIRGSTNHFKFDKANALMWNVFKEIVVPFTLDKSSLKIPKFPVLKNIFANTP